MRVCISNCYLNFTYLYGFYMDCSNVNIQQWYNINKQYIILDKLVVFVFNLSYMLYASINCKQIFVNIDTDDGRIKTKDTLTKMH